MTIGDLKALLESYPDNATLYVCGADSGGYDWTYLEKAAIEPLAGTDDRTVLFLKGIGDEAPS